MIIISLDPVSFSLCFPKGMTNSLEEQISIENDILKLHKTQSQYVLTNLNRLMRGFWEDFKSILKSILRFQYKERIFCFCFFFFFSCPRYFYVQMSLFTLEDFQWSFSPQQSPNVSNKQFWSKALKFRDVKAWTIHLEELFYWTGIFLLWNVNFNMPLMELKCQFHSLRKACSALTSESALVLSSGYLEWHYR